MGETISVGGGDCRPQGQNFYFRFPPNQNTTKLHNAHPSHAPNTHPELALELREGGKCPKVGGKRLEGWARRFQLGGVTADLKVRISIFCSRPIRTPLNCTTHTPPTPPTHTHSLH